MDKQPQVRKGFDYQERWHGFASPVGLGIGLVCLGAFAFLVSLAHYFWVK
jgi:hypothetical protein